MSNCNEILAKSCFFPHIKPYFCITLILPLEFLPDKHSFIFSLLNFKMLFCKTIHNSIDYRSKTFPDFPEKGLLIFDGDEYMKIYDLI